MAHRRDSFALLLVLALLGAACNAPRSASAPDVSSASPDIGSSTTATSPPAPTTIALPPSPTAAAPSTTTTSTTTTTTTTTTLPPASTTDLALLETIGGDISPKSVVASGTGLFFAQNMMYRHTITVYDGSYDLVKTISDEVVLADFGIDGLEGTHKGSPVEAAFTSDGRYAYVSNYEMYGDGYRTPGGDGCNNGGWDHSFLYRVDTQTLAIDQVIDVGAVPKYVAVTPDDSTVLVTNWCSFDLSIVDVATAVEAATVDLGRHPRGIAVAPDNSVAYVAVMGSRDIAVVGLDGLDVEWIRNAGSNPRHLVLSPDGRFLYATLNGDGRVVKIDLDTGDVIARVATGAAPRSMDISDDGEALYVVNYNSDTVSKVLTSDMTEVQELATNHHPIGITYHAGEVWVSNYSGTIQVFRDS